ncbi:CD209 antigen-like protein A isoform X2 [Poecilia formosa]|uniref:CD209 antigen-like protein A isoform X2 n=1 Tax=Poecilia formosa TaxID=48698 RepID=UPI0007B8FE11|nr:PREDICTED: CD209 antigen-like protein A isoform X2 [Poecilia formosa]
MARAANRQAAEIDYVNQPDPSTNGRPKLETGENHAESGTKLLRMVAVGFGLLCILQVALNVSLRLTLREYLQKGWLYFRDSFYYMSSIKKTWNESRKYCQQEGADLVVINSREEQNFTTQYSRGRLTWIGLYELGGTEQWIWVDGALLTDSYWGPNEPNRLEKVNPRCVEMRFFNTENSWNDISCTTENFWICEKETAL